MEDLLTEPPPLDARRATRERASSPLVLDRQSCPKLLSPPGPTRCATCSARGRRRSSCSTATSSTSCRTAASCSRSRPSSNRSCSPATTSCCATTAAAACARRAAATTGATGCRTRSGREATTQTLMREPGSALELIDRYLLRTLNLQALPGGRGQAEAHRRHHRVRRVRRAARRRAAARRPVRRQHRQGARLGQRSGRSSQSNIVTVLLSEGLHDLNALVVENPHAAALHLPLPTEADMLAYLKALATIAVSGSAGQVRRADRDARARG